MRPYKRAKMLNAYEHRFLPSAPGGAGVPVRRGPRGWSGGGQTTRTHRPSRLRHRLVQPEVVAAQDAHVGAQQRQNSGQVVVADLRAVLLEVGDQAVEVEGAPKGPGVQEESGRGEPVLLTPAYFQPRIGSTTA